MYDGISGQRAEEEAGSTSTRHACPRLEVRRQREPMASTRSVGCLVLTARCVPRDVALGLGGGVRAIRRRGGGGLVAKL